jgi:uncharacterized protein (UPF0332 family)
MEQVAVEWTRASKALRAAETLLDVQLPEDAVSRAYYAVLHAARAALFAHESVPKTHSGVRRLFGLELVDTGEIEREWGRILTRTQDRREDADYGLTTTIDENLARELFDDAHRFVDRMAAYLKSKGVVVPDAPPSD